MFNLIKGLVKSNHMLLRSIGRFVGAGLQKFQFHLQRCISKESCQLCLCIYFSRHQIENQNLQRSDVLCHGAGIGHDEDVLRSQCLNSR